VVTHTYKHTLHTNVPCKVHVYTPGRFNATEKLMESQMFAIA